MSRKPWRNFKISFHIQSSPVYLSFIRWLLPAIAKCVRLSGKSVHHASIAMVEAVNNAIFHAHGRKASIPIGFQVVVDKKFITIAVADQGRGFDISLVGRPKMTSTHGRGLLIIKGLMKGASYKKNVMRMWCER